MIIRRKSCAYDTLHTQPWISSNIEPSHTQISAFGPSISTKQVASKRFKMRRKMKLVWEFLQERRKSINFVN